MSEKQAVVDALAVLLAHVEEHLHDDIFTVDMLPQYPEDTRSPYLSALASALAGLVEQTVRIPPRARTGVQSCWIRSSDRPCPWPDPPAKHRRFGSHCVYARGDINKDFCLFCGDPEERK